MPDGAPPIGSMRVGFLALGGLGGSSKVAWTLAHGLRGRGHDAFVLSHPEAVWRDAARSAVPLRAVRAPLEPVAAEDAWVNALSDDLLELLRCQSIDVLSVHYGCGLAEAALDARDRAGTGDRPRVCVTLHGTDVSRIALAPAQHDRLRAALLRADAVTAVSPWLADRAVDVLGLPKRPRVVPNGVDVARFHPADAPAVDGVVCHVSNFRPVKRPLDAVEVFARLHAAGQARALWMVGDGPLRAAAQARAIELGIEAAVLFTGPLAPQALAERLRAASVVLVTSQTESFSLVALEAMACGALPVASRCDGLRDLLTHDPVLAEHCLAPVGDLEAFAARAGALLESPELAAPLRTRGISLAQTQFPRGEQLDRYASLFRAMHVRTAP
ncbi:MAG: glycosyltransferase [Myxococcota bacterium]